MAKGISEQDKHIFPKIGPLNNTTSVFSTNLDPTQINDLHRSDKIFIITKNPVSNFELVKLGFSHKNLTSTKIFINIKENDAQAQEIELLQFKSEAEGGEITRLNVKHQFASNINPDIRELHFQRENNEGKILDTLNIGPSSNPNSLFEKEKNFFNLPDSTDSTNTSLSGVQLFDSFISGLIGQVETYNANLEA